MPEQPAMEKDPPSPAPVHPPDGVLTSVKLLWPQYAAAAVVYLLYISYYLSRHIHADMYDNAPVWPRQEDIDAMFLSSTIAGILSYPIFVFLFEKLNRKSCVYITSTIFIVTCILHKTANTPFLFHVAHCLSATAFIGTIFTCTIYVTEIAQDNIRGSLLMGGELLFSAFHTVTVFIEKFIYMITFSWFALVPPVIVILCFLFWLPETPIYFLRRGNRDGATRSLLWLRRSNTTESMEQVVENLEEVLKATRSEAACSSNIFQELFNRRTLQYSGIALVLYLTENFSGFAEAMWIVTVLTERLGRGIHDIVYTLAEVTFVVGTFVAFLLCDTKGRRTLLFCSTVGCSVFLIPIAISSHIMTSENEFSITKMFAIAFAIAFLFVLGLGIRTVITVVLTDMFPPKILLIHFVIRGLLAYLFKFLDEYYINPRSWELKGLHPALFWTSSAVCASAALFIFKCLPETMKRPAGFVFMENRNEMILGNM